MNKTAAKPDPKVLMDMCEHFAAGYFEEPDASPMRRWSRAVRRRFEHRTLRPYNGTPLYPAGPVRSGAENGILGASYSYTWQLNEAELAEQLKGATGKARIALEGIRGEIHELHRKTNPSWGEHAVGGGGYTHSVPNYGRVVREGLNAHAARIAAGLEAAQQSGDMEKVDVYIGLQDVLDGVRAWHGHIVEHLRTRLTSANGHGPAIEALIAAYERVPWEPARDFMEALVAYNFVFYMDDCDNPGRVDLELWPYYERDLAAGKISHDDAVKLIRCLWENTDANGGWSAGIGGSTPEGKPNYTDLTIVCLEAAQSIRRPNLQLHIRRDMPDRVWDACIDTLATGCGLPALHNEEEFIRSLRDADLGVAEEDLPLHNGAGCTETLIHGLSNVGSLDADINLPLILVDTIHEKLPECETFDQFMAALKEEFGRVIAHIAERVSANQEAKAQWRPQPMRTLLIDDCIDRGREYNAGGARYNWSVINIAGLANVVDSLAAIREVVFEKREKAGAELCELLRANFEGDDAYRKRLEKCPRYGNDDPAADELLAEVSEYVFREFLSHRPWRGGRFLGSCLMFTTYAQAGAPVGATPDGRLAGAPLADSAGPMQGRDRSGPTAMVKSVTQMPHYLAPGTLVVNARFAKEFFTTERGRERLRELVRTYFDLGGMQIQINVVDQQVLKDAIAHPEQHEDLIVRVGGYSEYFNRLSSALKTAVLERVEHEAGE